MRPRFLYLSFRHWARGFEKKKEAASMKRLPKVKFTAKVPGRPIMMLAKLPKLKICNSCPRAKQLTHPINRCVRLKFGQQVVVMSSSSSLHIFCVNDWRRPPPGEDSPPEKPQRGEGGGCSSEKKTRHTGSQQILERHVASSALKRLLHGCLFINAHIVWMRQLALFP
mmetsp:Transcript_2907/g.7374  ORF Transcript_2907/g.7374 Transcript_2907/m.7374 type:complete len:168 (-) Transcript_2907:150-653(-)